MKEKKQYKRYSKAFKEEAVALVTEQGYSAQQAAEAIGVRANMIYRWKDRQDQEASSILTSDEKAELQSLRRQVKRLQMEKEILKKASALFAKEMK